MSACRDPAKDVAAFRAHGGHVLVGTPGRIDDIIKRCPAMDLKRLEVSDSQGCRVVSIAISNTSTWRWLLPRLVRVLRVLRMLCAAGAAVDAILTLRL
jgi:hypothetical protein